MSDNDYNKRLFSKTTLRGKLHNARFTWLKEKIKKHSPNYETVLELGCFDGKVIHHLPQLPKLYEGWDANWEGGLDLAIDSWKDKDYTSFHQCESYEDFKPTQQVFDISLCMETLEHLPIYNYEKYIKTLAKHTNGFLFVTIPNEKKIPFVLKYLVKSTVLRKQKLDQYTYGEIWNASIGRLDKVKRINTSHKGFDYEKMIQVLEKYFTITSLEGIPFAMLGHRLNFTVGVVCKAK